MVPSVACSFFFDDELLGEPGMPAMDACALCAKPLSRDHDVFMYRRDMPRDAVCAKQAARRQQRFSAETESHRGQRQSRKVSVAS
ncbi:hypothetical protein TRIUR3_24039 [Triticum urartu]|uniref:Uncharacterized protein n=1 Tax=Triticum urartu TaxID=4572 RepID=M7ZQ87_TRIUA|nr:hypothetical protein TRIUR3_24039 [Triticum urartu]